MVGEPRPGKSLLVEGLEARLGTTVSVVRIVTS